MTKILIFKDGVLNKKSHYNCKLYN